MKSFLSITLAFLIVFSTMGFTWSTHICGGHKVKTLLNIGKSDVSCGMEDDYSLNNSCSNKEQMESNCCQNEYLTYQIENNYIQKDIIKDISIDFVIAFVYTFIDFSSNYKANDKYTNYFPPPLVRNIPVLNQSFLI